MDKKETTRLLSNLIQYNTVDINNMITTFPEIGKAFMNVISAIDEEYGSGSIDKNLLTPDPTAAQTKKVDFKEFGDSFIGKYIYKPNSKEWYYFDSITNYDEANQRYTFKIYTNNAFSNSNVAEEINWSKSILEELLNTKEYAGWKLFTLNVGDKVTVPKTKQGVAGVTSGALETARLRGQNYLYIVEIQKNGKILLWYDYTPANGDFFIMQDVEPYEENEEKLGFKVGDYYTSEKWKKGTWVKITDITQDQVNGFDEKGKPYLNYILNFKKELASGYFKIIPDPNAPQPKKVDFKEGDRFYVQYSPKALYTIKKINQNDIIIGYTDVAGKYKENARTIKDVQENFDMGVWILSGKSTASVKYITQWTPDWKARGLRPSPTRKASLEKVDALGLGNDGIIYKVEEDKKGVKKWKKTRYNVFNSNNRADFTSRYDLEMLYDQLVYENTELDSTDIEFKDNEKLITIIINKLK
jgi:hypothetical protein